jgi:hypothetical protein
VPSRAERAGGIIDRRLTYRVENINNFDVDEILGRHRWREDGMRRVA